MSTTSAAASAANMAVPDLNNEIMYREMMASSQRLQVLQMQSQNQTLKASANSTIAQAAMTQSTIGADAVSAAIGLVKTIKMSQ